MIHRLADVQTGHIGDGTRIWQFCVVLQGAQIGKNCNICANVLIENDVRIGDNVTIKSGVQLWDGVILEDNVFVGPNVTFTNDKYPRSKVYPETFAKTVVKKSASIGANATIVCGVTIGENAMIGAGSVVTKDVPAGELWVGNPAKKLRDIMNTKQDNTHNSLNISDVLGGVESFTQQPVVHRFCISSPMYKCA